MILVDAGQMGERQFDAVLRFAARLSARGHDIAIDEELLQPGLARAQKYESAPLLTKVALGRVRGVIILGAEDISDDTLFRLRSYNLPKDANLAALGRFETHQSRLTAQTRLAYALGREPLVVDLAELQPNSLAVSGIAPQIAAGALERALSDGRPEVFVYLPAEALDEPGTLPMLTAIHHMPRFDLRVIVTGKAKDEVRKTRYSGLRIFGYAELTPATLARHCDVAVFFGDGIPGERMAMLALNVLAGGRAVVDCTTDRAFVASGAPVLRGPADLAALPVYLESTVLPNLGSIRDASLTDPWIAEHDIARLETALSLPVPLPKPKGASSQKGERAGQAVFIPTNGSGLGHAQRCALIAGALGTKSARFMAFPSCVPLLNRAGFGCAPLVQASPDHDDDFANDLVNYLRYRRHIGPGDHLVFDGGYVFDSIWRTILEKGLTATWVRRGLMRPGQIAQLQSDREAAFSQVIVPREAFGELNAQYSASEAVHSVGPIVQPPPSGTDTGREALQAKLGRPFESLVVTMLGGGVAADRTAQMLHLCAILEKRPGCQHLIVAWPGARMAPGLFGWRQTRVVTTLDALSLCRSADLVVSAVGYNSFHEVLYHQIPAIFMPQTGPHMDDQERRARAASERGLAETVLAHELLVLEREIGLFLDSGKAADIRQRLKAEPLPQTGTKAAAELIERAAR